MSYVQVGTENGADINIYYEDHGQGQVGWCEVQRVDDPVDLLRPVAPRAGPLRNPEVSSVLVPVVDLVGDR